jgi:tRNA threonylcarbamoyladenosine biosynthesis protein TsaB
VSETPLILGFDTSAAHCAAALVLGDAVIAARHEEMSKGQAERLMVLIQDVLADADKTVQDLTAIGVGTGPGNFTGIRISVAAARGLALSLKIPAVGVSLLDVYAHDIDQPRLVAIDARRDRFYVQTFDDSSFAKPELIAFEDLTARDVPEDIAVTGPAAAMVAQAMGLRRLPAPSSPAPNIAQIARTRYLTETLRPAPVYMRAADAAPSSDKPPKILS